MSINPWKTLGSTLIYSNPWFEVRKDDVIRPDGEPGIYSVVKANRVATGIVPLWDDATVTLVGQYRYPIEEYSWELPEGGGSLDGDPLDAAKRELKEETGIEADSWSSLGRCHLSNCFLDEVCHLYVARTLRAGKPVLLGDEELTTRRVPLREARDMAADGRITDAVTIVALYRLAEFLDAERRSK